MQYLMTSEYSIGFEGLQRKICGSTGFERSDKPPVASLRVLAAAVLSDKVLCSRKSSTLPREPPFRLELRSQPNEAPRLQLTLSACWTHMVYVAQEVAPCGSSFPGSPFSFSALTTDHKGCDAMRAPRPLAGASPRAPLHASSARVEPAGPRAGAGRSRGRRSTRRAPPRAWFTGKGGSSGRVRAK